MTDYSQGKIYKIVCNETGDVYIGSTATRLCNRLARHKHGKQYYSSKQIIERNNYQMILIENYPCETKEELLWRERYYIDNTNCVNKHRPIITQKEKKERIIKQKKQQYLKNKQKLLERTICVCGGCYNKNGIYRHLKTKKHQVFISQYNTNGLSEATTIEETS